MDDQHKFKLVEIFESVKGEGVNTGIPMTFVRFAGCNLNCSFCDTPFETVFEMAESQLIARIRSRHPSWVVFTGGEPSLQLTTSLVKAISQSGIKTVLETNGVEWNDAFDLIDYVTISPKEKAEAVHPMWYMYCQRNHRAISEIRYLIIGDKIPFILTIASEHICISPMFVGGKGNLRGEPDKTSLATAIALVQSKKSLGYRLSIQVHKLIGVR